MYRSIPLGKIRPTTDGHKLRLAGCRALTGQLADGRQEVTGGGHWRSTRHSPAAAAPAILFRRRP